VHQYGPNCEPMQTDYPEAKENLSPHLRGRDLVTPMFSIQSTIRLERSFAVRRGQGNLSNEISNGNDKRCDYQLISVVDENGMAVDLFTVNLSPSVQDVIVTSAVGNEYFERWKAFSFPTWKRYAHEHQLGIVVVLNRLIVGPESIAKNASWDKLLAPLLLSQHFPKIERVALLDTDVVISPFAPNLFDLSEPGSYSVVSQERGLPFPIREVRQRIALLRQWFYDDDYPQNSILQATAEEVFSLQGLPAHPDYFCAGLIVLDSSLFEDLANCHASISSDRAQSSFAWEEPFVNDWIQSRNHIWMPYEYQAIWLFEMAWYYPHLYGLVSNVPGNRAVADVIGSVMLNRFFLHFAGSWFEADAWKNILSDTFVFDAKFISRMSKLNSDPKPVESFGKIAPSRKRGGGAL